MPLQQFERVKGPAARVCIFQFSDEYLKHHDLEWPFSHILHRRPLTITPGQLVEVVDESLGEWIYGFAVENADQMGYFPREFCMPVTQYIEMMECWGNDAERRTVNWYAEDRRRKQQKEVEEQQQEARAKKKSFLSFFSRKPRAPALPA
mmetsp:Transcript_43355/g.97597  ORF Transcript_43355/g.97597 Transcript_43355/m.97597 type:complete len:149 (+) Transcript_43355:267-713(+)